MGMLGENQTPDEGRVWVCKTHYPTGTPDCKKFPADKLIVVHRNPIDVFPSFASLSQTMSHSLVSKEKFHEDFPEWWEQWVSACSGRMESYHEFLVNDMAAKTPTYITRYEDLVLNPEPALKEIFCLLLDVTSIEGTIAEKRI